MPSLPSPPSEPAPVSSRKRQRTQSMSSETSSSKRAASEEPGSSTLSDGVRSPDVTLRAVPSLSAMNISSTPDADIDSYMAEQESANVNENGAAQLADDADELDPQLRREQRQLQILEAKKQPLVVGETWYMVCKRWFDKWETVCTGTPQKGGTLITEEELGPVDNSVLISHPGMNNNTLMEGLDFEFLPQSAWKLLENWYGSCKNPLPRKVIELSTSHEKVIEMYPPRIRLYRLVVGDGKELSGGSEVWLQTSKAAKVHEVIEAAAARLAITAVAADLRAWRIDSANTDLPASECEYPVGRLEDDNATKWPSSNISADASLEVADLDHGDALILEGKVDGKWIVQEQSPPPVLGVDYFANKFGGASRSPLALHKAPSVTTTSNAITVRNRPAQPAIKRGTMGLVNLGNTCFMNSALQCLAHTKELTEYFLTGVFKEELNPTNPLGMQGAIAEAYGSLLQRLYDTGSNSMAPREFKTALQRFAPQFIGYQQHDSQELLAFLLDGLHEDLNRILKKPYVENPDWEGGGNKELVQLARTTWNGYLSRNDSVIVDLFQGQYKSTLICPECRKISITFDPFMYLTLPLPVDRRWSHSVYFIPLDPDAKSLNISVDLHANSSIRDLKQLLGRWLEKDPQKLQIMEFWSHKVYKHYDDGYVVSQIQKSDVVACYELPCPLNATRKAAPPKDHIIVPVYHRVAKAYKVSYMSTYQHSDLFGEPLVVAFTLEEAKDPQLIYNKIVRHYARWTMHARDLFSWAPVDAPKPAEETNTEVTEFRANGDVVTGGDTQEPTTNGTESAGEHMDVDNQIENLGPKAELFTLVVNSTSGELDSQWTMGKEMPISERLRDYEASLQADAEAEDAPAAGSSKAGQSHNEMFGCLRRGDIITCEWQPTTQQYYFGDNEKDAKWSHLEEFVHPEYTKAQEEAEAKKNRTLDLNDCLDEFTREEKLGEDDLWFCPRCKKHQQATKRFDLWKLPDILVVHLKRFSNSRMLRDKIETLVDFPIEGLDLEARVGERQALKELAETEGVPEEWKIEGTDEPLVYDLYAVDEHMGGLGGGHYRAYAKNAEDDLWYHYDDSHVSRSQPKEAVTPYAYLLFYRRRSKRPIGGKSHDKIDAARSKVPEELEAEPAAAPEQLPTPNDSPPRYPYTKLPDSLDSLAITTVSANRMKSPFDTPGTSPATPDDDDLSTYTAPYDSSSISMNSTVMPGGLSPSSSVEAEWDSDDASRPTYGRLRAAFPPETAPTWGEASASPRTPASDDRDFDERVATMDSETVDMPGGLLRPRSLFGDDGDDVR